MTLAAWVEVLKTNTDNHTQNRQPIIMTRNVFISHREDGQFLNAVIDDVRIWNRVLEPDEIVETMESPLTGLAVHPNSRLASKWGDKGIDRARGICKYSFIVLKYRSFWKCSLPF